MTPTQIFQRRKRDLARMHLENKLTTNGWKGLLEIAGMEKELLILKGLSPDDESRISRIRQADYHRGTAKAYFFNDAEAAHDGRYAISYMKIIEEMDKAFEKYKSLFYD